MAAVVEADFEGSSLPWLQDAIKLRLVSYPDFNPAPLMHLATDIGWLERAENCLIFGPSGTGKTHVAIGVARAIIEQGKRAKFSATSLVQQLQQAKLQLVLPAMLGPGSTATTSW